MKRKKDLINACCDKAFQGRDELTEDYKHDFRGRLKNLSVGNLEIVFAKIIGFSNREIAGKKRVSDSAISQRLQKIKKLLKI